jgi:RimJ/RimL family protein N-acetyltransferase
MKEKMILEGHTIFLALPSLEEVRSSGWNHWYNDYETTAFNSHGIFPITVEKEVQYVEQALNDPHTILLAIYAKDENLLIGNIALQSIDLLNRKCALAITIGCPEFRGRTCALEAVGLLLDHAFNRLNLNRVYIGLDERLARWGKMLKVLGFQDEGVLRKDLLRNGKFWDMICMAVLAEDFSRLKSEREGNILFSNISKLLKALVREK